MLRVSQRLPNNVNINTLFTEKFCWYCDTHIPCLARTRKNRGDGGHDVRSVDRVCVVHKPETNNTVDSKSEGGGGAAAGDLLPKTPSIAVWR